MIFLRRLELHGFKSFAGKTVLEFPSRIVGIVGPNGAGKSNVIDALRWVLGEREAKQLRGMTLENLIFAGTPKKPSMGFAKVGLTFDNRENLFPVDTKEVSLSRRVDRSGVSEFSLNGEEVRLRDLLQLLARAKLGTRGLTMIGQGQSSLFVESDPNLRRAMIEEVLGLKEFRLKKHDAERRLQGSESNMEKVRAQIQELSPHLSFLRRQRKKWEKRSEIADTLRDMENHYYGGKLHELLHTKELLAAPMEKLKGKETQVRREIRELEEKLGKLKERSGEAGDAKRIREEISSAFARRAETERALARTEVELEFKAKTSERDVSLAASVEALRFSERELWKALASGDASLLRRIVEAVLEKIAGVLAGRGGEEKKHEELLREKSRLEKELGGLNEKIKACEARAEEIATLQDKANEEWRSRIEALEVRKNEARKIEHDIQTQLFECEKVNLKIDEIEREWIAFGRNRDELRSLPESPSPSESEPDVERKMFRLRGQLAEIGEIDEALVKEAEESEARFAFLTREEKDVAYAVRDLEKLIRDLDEKIHLDFDKAFHKINAEFQTYFSLMFGGGRARLKLEKPVLPKTTEENSEAQEAEVEEEKRETRGVEIEVSIPRKKIANLEMLSGGEKSLVSLAALFALVSVSPPPFLVLDEIDAALDDANARKFAELLQEFSKKTQFIIVTHNRVTMEVADALYGVTMADDGVSKLLSIKFEEGVGLTKGAK